MTSQLSHVNRDPSLSNAKQHTQIKFLSLNWLYTSELLIKRFIAVVENYFKPKLLL